MFAGRYSAPLGGGGHYDCCGGVWSMILANSHDEDNRRASCFPFEWGLI